MIPSTEKPLGHFKIMSQLASGGMGDVFLAEDTDLERKVALKILPEKFTVDTVTCHFAVLTVFDSSNAWRT